MNTQYNALKEAIHQTKIEILYGEKTKIPYLSYLTIVKITSLPNVVWVYEQMAEVEHVYEEILDFVLKDVNVSFLDYDQFLKKSEKQ
jgi:hypothetical protein